MRELQEESVVKQDKSLETSSLNRSKTCARYESTIMLELTKWPCPQEIAISQLLKYV